MPVNRHAWRRAVLRSRALPAGTKVAAMAIYEFVNSENGEAYPAYATIADACGMEVAGVRAAVKRLVGAGLLQAKRRGFGGTNLLTIQLSENSPSCPIPLSPQRNEASIPLSPQRSFRYGDSAHTATAIAVNQSNNQKYNPSLPSPPACDPGASRAEANDEPCVRRSGEPYGDYIKRKLADDVKRITPNGRVSEVS